jgi:hypothetical protein
MCGHTLGDLHNMTSDPHSNGPDSRAEAAVNPKFNSMVLDAYLGLQRSPLAHRQPLKIIRQARLALLIHHQHELDHSLLRYCTSQQTTEVFPWMQGNTPKLTHTYTQTAHTRRNTHKRFAHQHKIPSVGINDFGLRFSSWTGMLSLTLAGFETVARMC